MVRFCLQLLLASLAVSATLRPGVADNVLAKRALLGPISTSSAAGIAGGTVACDAAPVGSFFDGLKPPVRTSASIMVKGQMVLI
jgi:hypothetical protein